MTIPLPTLDSAIIHFDGTPVGAKLRQWQNLNKNTFKGGDGTQELIRIAKQCLKDISNTTNLGDYDVSSLEKELQDKLATLE